jgi:ribonuclease HII
MRVVVGSDEVGLGAWAGPLVVCAAAVPFDWNGVEGLGDSKELKRTGKLAGVYLRLAGLPCALMAVTHDTIDRIGLRAALIAAHTDAISAVSVGRDVDCIVIDGEVCIPAFPHAQVQAKADSLYPAVMAASVIAKYNRDFLMSQYHAQYPAYGFDTNAGYGVPKHIAALKHYGPCPRHRRSVRPVAELPKRT